MFALRALAGVGAAVAALALSMTTASACWSGCGFQTYVPPPVMVAPSCGCGGYGGGYYAPQAYVIPYLRPAYRVDQGPAYDVPPPTAAEPVPEEYGYPRSYRYGGYEPYRRVGGYYPRAYRHHVGYRTWGPGPRFYGPRRYGPGHFGPHRYYRGLPVRG